MQWLYRRMGRLAEFVAALDERPEVDRASFVCLLCLAAHVVLTATFYSVYFLAPQAVVATRDIAYGQSMSHMLGVGLIIYLIEYGLLRWASGRGRIGTVVMYLFFQTVGTIQFYVIQALGTYSTAMMMFYPIDIAIIFLLFNERKALFVLIYGGILFTSIGILEHLGRIPYAPLIHPDLRPVPPPLGPLVQEVVFLWGLCTLLYLILYYVHSNLRETTRRLREAKDRLVRQESLAAIGSLVTGAAHELRNPLSSSGALLQSLLEDLRSEHPIDGELRKDAVHAVQMALTAQGRAASIVDRLYQLSDDLAQASSQCRLSTLLDNLARKYNGTEISCSGVDFSTPVQERPLNTILSNLLDNAWSSGGTRPPALAVGVCDGHLELTVADTGSGVPPDLHKSIFKPFFTTRKAGEGHGAGLGLYIVHELVTRMDGTIDFQSQPGKGTRVTMRFPRERGTGAGTTQAR